MQWWVARNGQQLGPFEHSDLIQRAARRELLPTDLLWRVGLPAWTAAKQIPGLLAPPPLPRHPVNSSLPPVPRTTPPPLPSVAATSGGPPCPSIQVTSYAPIPPIGEATPGGGRSYYQPNAGTNWYFEVLRKYAVFRGRARRREFWFFILFHCIISFAMGLVDAIAGIVWPQLGPLTLIYLLATMLPHLAVSVRRLHDTGRSGWWLLVAAIPIVGALVLLVFCAEDSQAGDNNYGPSPKELGAG